jgi:hypothetical protein
VEFLFALFILNWFDWKTLKTEHFTIIYKAEYQWEAYQTLRNLEYYRANIVDLTGNDTRSVPVVIEDLGTLSNGFADPFLYNIHIFTYPPGFGSSLEGVENWYRTVSIHEYTHICHLTKTKGVSRFLTGLFGAPFQSNMYSPGWVIEGITVFSESEISPYEGRLNDGFFDSYIAARVHDAQFPSIIEATNTPLIFPSSGIYLYGGEFFEFLARRYGRARFRRFFDYYGSYFWSPLATFLPCIGLDIAACKVYGKSFPVLFRDWQRYEKERFADWQIEGENITQHGWYISSLVSKDNTLYFVHTRPIKLDAFYWTNQIKIMALDLAMRKEKTVVTLISSVTTPLRISNNNLYYTTLELKRGMPNVWLNGFGATSTLHQRNLFNHKDICLFTDDIRAFCILPDNTILYSKDRAHSFGSELWVYTEDIREKIWETDYLVNELLANENWIIAACSKAHENPDLYIFNPETKTFAKLLATPWCEGCLNFISDNELLFTANFDGRHAIYMLDLKQDSMWRLTENGYTNCGVVIEHTLYYIALNSSGYDIYKKQYAEESYTLPVWSPTAVPTIYLSEDKVKHGGYFDVMTTLFPTVRVPFVFPRDRNFNSWYLGGLVFGGDATQENIYTGLIAHSTIDEHPVINLFWQSKFLSPLDLNIFFDYNNSVYYQLSCPVITRLNPGLTNFLLFVNGRSFEHFNRKEVTPGFILRLGYPYTSIIAQATFPFERQSWGSEISRNGQYFNCGIKQYLLDGEASLWASAFSDTQNPDTSHIRIRGYKTIPSPRGIVLRTEYSHLLLKIRQGLWNPNIFFEDLYVTLFFDYGFIHNQNSFYSFGGEFKLEVKTGFGFIQFYPKVGLAITKDKTAKIFFEIVPLLQNPYF